MSKKKLEKLSEEEIKELDSHINFLLTSIEPITKQLVEPRFCLTFGKKRFTRGYVYKFGKNKQVYKTNEKAKDIKTFEDIKNQILSSKYYKEFKKINIGLHSWNKNTAGEFLVFLDIDNKNLLENKAISFKQEIEKQGIKSLIQKSPSGGNHILLFVKSEKELKNVYGIVPNVDLICRPQSYVIAAGGTTEKGTYSLSSISNIQTIDLNEIPKLVFNAANALNLQDIKSPEEILNNWIDCEKQEGENPKHLKEKVFKTLPKNLKKRFNLAFEKKEAIHKGQRMHFLRHVSSKFLSENTKVSQKDFVKFCHNINEEFMNPELPFQEVEDFARSYQKEFYSSIRKFKLTIGEDLKSAMDSIKQNLLILPKEEDYKNFVQCSIVDSKIQNLLEELLNKKFKKNLPDGTVSKLFKESGFSKIQSKKKESRDIRFYNISPSSLSSLLSSLSVGEEEKSNLSHWICNVGCPMNTNHSNQMQPTIYKTKTQEINLKAQESPQVPEAPITPTLPETKPELILEAPVDTQAAAASSEGCEEKVSHEEYEKQIQESSQEISLKTQESNIHTQEQKECPAEPSSKSKIDSETQEQARLQEIEFELTAITNSKELSLKEKKELYSAVALKLNSKDLNKISKNLLNFIPSDDYRKICRR